MLSYKERVQQQQQQLQVFACSHKQMQSNMQLTEKNHRKRGHVILVHLLIRFLLILTIPFLRIT